MLTGGRRYLRHCKASRGPVAELSTRTILLADCMAAAEETILTYPHRWGFGSVEEYAALETCQLAS